VAPGAVARRPRNAGGRRGWDGGKLIWPAVEPAGPTISQGVRAGREGPLLRAGMGFAANSSKVGTPPCSPFLPGAHKCTPHLVQPHNTLPPNSPTQTFMSFIFASAPRTGLSYYLASRPVCLPHGGSPACCCSLSQPCLPTPQSNR